MPKYDLAGRPLTNSDAVKVAAGQTTANVSTPHDEVRGRDYLSHVIITAASTAAPGAVTLFDGTTSLFVHSFHPTQQTELVQVVKVDMTATSTVGWNITTGTSVSCVAIGRFGPGA